MPPTLTRAWPSIPHPWLRVVAALAALVVQVLNSLLNIWENTAYLSDLALRLPDIVHRMVDGHETRISLLDWSIALCLSSPVFDGPHSKAMTLLRQELRIGEYDPNYTNPFSEENIKKAKAEHDQTASEKQEATEKLERKLERKPRISRLRVDL